MRLTFPIDVIDPVELDEFSGITEEYQASVPDLSGMLKYLVYRFDPKCTDVQRAMGVGDKEVVAQRLAGWSPPEMVLGYDEKENPIINHDWLRFSRIQGEFFSILDNDEWEFIVSLDIAIHNAHMIIREPIPADMDPEKRGKVLLNIQKAIEGNKEAIATRKATALAMADNDQSAAKNIMSATKATARRPVSPEGHVRTNGR